MEWFNPKDKLPMDHQMVLILTTNVRYPEVAELEKYDGFEEWYIFANDDVEKTENVLMWSPIELPERGIIIKQK